MVDLHTHILHGVDDGASTVDEAVNMLIKAHEIGINAIVLTPHVSLFRGFKTSKELTETHFNMLKDKIKQLGLSLHLFLGAEIDEHDHLVKTIKQGYTLEGSTYVLIDFSMRRADVSEILYGLRHSGYKVIVAHPERISYLNFHDLKQLKAEGALMQVSSSHLLPWKFDRASRIAKRLLRQGLIDVVASDAHHMETLLTMKKSFAYVSKTMGNETAQTLFVDNPSKIIGIQEPANERN